MRSRLAASFDCHSCRGAETGQAYGEDNTILNPCSKDLYIQTEGHNTSRFQTELQHRLTRHDANQQAIGSIAVEWTAHKINRQEASLKVFGKQIRRQHSTS